MKYKLYKNSIDNDTLILFFNGWAMTPESVEHLNIPQDMDLIILWDYRELNAPLDIIQSYSNVYIVAWSMGVWAANKVIKKETFLPNIIEAVAVCGTAYPMNDIYGIPQTIFEGTLNSISEENRDRFNRRMCGGKSLIHLFNALKERSTNEIKEELEIVYNQSLVTAVDIEEDRKKSFWTRAWIGGKDRIIPQDNQRRYWEEMIIPIEIKPSSQHYIFQEFKCWDEIW